MEIWKAIYGYEKIYEISNLGRVKSLKRKRKCGYTKQCSVKEKILKQNSTKKGYLYVNLYKNGVGKHHYIHRLVADAFIPNLNNLPQINHKDENKANNCVDNLEWCTQGYNGSYNNLKERIKKIQISKYGKMVCQYDLEGNFIKYWDSIREAERILNIPHQNIINCCKGKVKTAGGYIWKYQTEYNVANAILGGM